MNQGAHRHQAGCTEQAVEEVFERVARPNYSPKAVLQKLICLNRLLQMCWEVSPTFGEGSLDEKSLVIWNIFYMLLWVLLHLTKSFFF